LLGLPSYSMKTFDKHYKEVVLPQLAKEGGYSNFMAVPKIEKVVINTGVGSVKDENKKKSIVESISMIAGLIPSPRKAKTSIASFKLREGQVVGYAVTLRGQRMRDFVSKLINVIIPRIRDFRGLDLNIVDSMGNMTIGFRDHTVFPETSEHDVRSAFGLAVTVTTTAKTKKEALALFLKLGFPFKKAGEENIAISTNRKSPVKNKFGRKK